MALRRVPIPSPNYSSRGGASVRLVVLHTAEGARTYADLGAYFQGDVGVSSHTGIDDTVGEVGEYVAPGGKAWTAADYNPVAVQAELCAFADWDSAEWHRHPNMLANAAAWVAEECSRFGIPVVALDAASAQGGGRGVTQHADLGAAGGGHWDCGPGFPMGEVIAIAGGQPAPPSTPSTPPPPSGIAAPPWPGVYLAQYTEGHGTATWQTRMVERGWSLAIDDIYGAESSSVCWAFQQEAVDEGYDPGGVDGVVGPKTWALAWEKPVT